MRYNKKTDTYESAVKSNDRRYVNAAGVVYAPWLENRKFGVVGALNTLALTHDDA